jgi:thiamine pyrophosphokinase
LRTIIFANGRLSQPPELRPDDWIIAADGGARHCLAWGLRPRVVIGDLDSLSEDDLASLNADQVQIIQHPRRKDYTDLELALEYALKQGADEIIIVAALGERWDQTLANLLLPAAFAPGRIRLVDDHQEIGFLRSGEHTLICGEPGDTVSLIPLSKEARGIYTQHLEYPLDNETLHFGSTRGISNVLLEQSGYVSLQEGLVAYVVIHERKESDVS